MRRLALAGALILIAGLVVIAGRAYVRRRLLPEAARHLGRPVRAGGIGVGWPPALVLRDVRVEGVLDAAEARVTRNSIALLRPTLRLAEWPRRPAGGGGGAAVAATPARTRRVTARDATLILPVGRLEAARASCDVGPGGRVGRIAARGVRFSSERASVADITLYADRESGGWRVRLDARGARLTTRALASRAVGPFAFGFDGFVAIDGRLRVRDSRARVGALRVALDAEAGAGKLRASARLPRVRCAEALASLPSGLAPTLAGLVLSGDLEARIDIDADAAAPGAARLDVAFPRVCRVVADAPAAPVPRLLDASAPAGPHRVVAAPLDSLGRHLPAAFVAAEDARFFAHAGFDLDRIRQALAYDLGARHFARGASTISQQLAKNLYLSHDRNVGRKLEEALLAWRIEQVVPKRRILEVYLSVIEMGPGVRGVVEAARTYFDREPRALGPLEAAHLAALTPAPNTYVRQLDGRKVPWEWYRRVFTIIDGMRRADSITRREWLDARARKLQIRTLAAARRARK